MSTNEVPFWAFDTTFFFSRTNNTANATSGYSGPGWTNTNGIFRLTVLSGKSVQLRHLNLGVSTTLVSGFPPVCGVYRVVPVEAQAIQLTVPRFAENQNFEFRVTGFAADELNIVQFSTLLWTRVSLGLAKSADFPCRQNGRVFNRTNFG